MLSRASIFFSALNFFLLTSGSLKAAEGTAQTIMEAARDSVVVIRQLGRDGLGEGIGTGFVISKDGLIATSLHVIGEARPLAVSLADGKQCAVTEIHAWDRKLDLAIIRVDARELTPLRLADSDNLKAGADVVAIGNPQGLAHSVVQGVVSAIRDFEFGPMIQLAIPIEPGNSGGPLLDLRGKVQGILEMKSAVTENLGFAIPINALKRLIEKPNTVPFEKWLAIGALDPQQWKSVMGGQWRRRSGLITVEGAGTGFGGRALCLAQQKLPNRPYEIAVAVRLDDEAGAAGLVFGSDGADRHYGFYPSGGQLRLTRFDGPSVYSWNILRQIDTSEYQPGEWNRLKVRIEENRIRCYVNGELVTEIQESVSTDGLAGLAKFRSTAAKFKNFQIGPALEDLGRTGEQENLLRSEVEKGVISNELLKEPGANRRQLLALARDYDRKANTARKLARELNDRTIQQELASLFQAEEADIDLFAATLLIARLEDPEVELQAYRDEIDAMAREMQKRWPTPVTNREKLDHLRKYLFDESGFHGSRSDYYNRANSSMNRVLEDREGIPITLSVLVLELGRKLAIEKLEGMPFPGHFMVRLTDASSEPIYIDVFDGGKVYQKSELYDLIARHSEVPLLNEHFNPATKSDIIVRMLKNLVATLQETPALPYLDLILTLTPDDPREHWRRASLRLQSGNRSGAEEDLQWLLDRAPAEFDRARVEELLKSLKARN